MDADLVLEGGGVKGIGLAGAVAVLTEHGYGFHRVAGTSAGAIVGALVAAGMKSADLNELMRTIDYGSFKDEGFIDHLGLVGKGLSLLFEKGIYEGDHLRDWLDAQLRSLGVRTFGDLKITDDPTTSLPPERRYRLVVHTADISSGVLVRLPWDYARYGLDPDSQLIADAVRASMSIPFFYEPVAMKDHDDGKTHLLVDGGMLSNFPIDAFDRTDGKRPRWPTFGVKLSARPDANQVPNETKGILGFGKALISTMTSFHDQMHLDDPAVIARTIFVDTFKVRATDFAIDRATQDALYESGRKYAERFITGWDFEKYVATYRSAPG